MPKEIVELALPKYQKSIKSRDQHKVYKIGGDPEFERNETNQCEFKKRLKIVSEELLRGENRMV